MKGQKVCRFHGGAAPQCRAAAERRLAALVDPAIGALDKLVHKARNETVKLNAARDILDRTGHKQPDLLTVNVEEEMRVNVQATVKVQAEALAGLSPEDLSRLYELVSRVTVAGSNKAGDADAGAPAD